MTTYSVIDKASGAVVYHYDSDAVIEWDGMELATHDHIAVAAPAPTRLDGQRRLTKLQFTDRMGDAAYAAVLQMARVSPEVEVFVDRFRNTAQEADGTSVDLDDPRTVAGVRTIGVALLAQGLVSETWADEVLHG